ncbi:cytochrome c oxidase subunit II [Pelagibacterium xiamenense]|uniref:cytochrome c oxidase subunit II n=1 Tax=Pelagibacterium xiamenense TaxID=2901140 RepID=UPI001E47EF2F|nr:c-type cytochrome [Pelagibacterium xiamenense]MCD7058662.1 c-type cytochrome [Pelagibacterium xiamenense]
MRFLKRAVPAIVAPAALAGCSNIQSAFAPMGVEAERTNVLFWVMTAGGTLIFIAVLIAASVSIFGGERARKLLAREWFVTAAGIWFPVVVLSTLLVYGFIALGAGAAPERAQNGLKISVEGELWWWRVTYERPDGTVVETANELHLPVGEPVQVALTSTNVIHSFWAPRIAGKLDMIPGRTNTLTLTATEEGVSRGQCAEYCGGAHALMSFFVIAQSPEEFEAWLAAEARPAEEPEGEAETRGRDLFFAAGCGACHTVRGTAAEGTIGPDLTHVGARRSLAAATLPNDAEAFADWIVDNQHIKPENKMPAYDIFSDEDVSDLARYLEGLN